MDEKEFKSIHIDLEKEIFLLNGEKMNGVFNLTLEFNGEWSLYIEKMEFYEPAATKAIKD